MDKFTLKKIIKVVKHSWKLIVSTLTVWTLPFITLFLLRCFKISISLHNMAIYRNYYNIFIPLYGLFLSNKYQHKQDVKREVLNKRPYITYAVANGLRSGYWLLSSYNAFPHQKIDDFFLQLTNNAESAAINIKIAFYNESNEIIDAMMLPALNGKQTIFVFSRQRFDTFTIIFKTLRGESILLKGRPNELEFSEKLCNKPKIKTESDKIYRKIAESNNKLHSNFTYVSETLLSKYRSQNNPDVEKKEICDKLNQLKN